MLALPVRSGDTADLLKRPPTPVLRGSPWPYRIAVPFIMLLSLSLWAVLWQTAAFAIAAVFS